MAVFFSRTAGLKNGLFAFFLVLSIEKENIYTMFFLQKQTSPAVGFTWKLQGPPGSVVVGATVPSGPPRRRAGLMGSQI